VVFSFSQNPGHGGLGVRVGLLLWYRNGSNDLGLGFLVPHYECVEEKSGEVIPSREYNGVSIPYIDALEDICATSRTMRWLKSIHFLKTCVVYTLSHKGLNINIASNM
jgi:hypothetical protein